MFNGGTLLDHTAILFGCGMATGTRATTNLPLVLAGGGFKHGEHKVYPQPDQERVPAANLLLSILQNSESRSISSAPTMEVFVARIFFQLVFQAPPRCSDMIHRKCHCLACTVLSTRTKSDSCCHSHSPPTNQPWATSRKSTDCSSCSLSSG